MLTVVTGPPCSGKTTHVNARAKRGDIVIDLDRIALALTTEDTDHHEYAHHIRVLAMKARAAVIRAAMPMRHDVNVWLIHSDPSAEDLRTYRQSGARVVECSAPMEVLLSRAARERPTWMSQLIKQWHAHG
jgi:tRNA uridine 5-carbamoylmethylation protein Kti12